MPVTVLPDGSRIYVANAGTDDVSVIDAATNTVIDTVGVGDNPVGVAALPDGSAVYVVNASDDSVCHITCRILQVPSSPLIKFM